MAAAQALGTGGNEGGCTNSWEAARDVAQLGEDRHQGEGGGPTRGRQKWVGSQASLTQMETKQHPMSPGASLPLPPGMPLSILNLPLPHISEPYPLPRAFSFTPDFKIPRPNPSNAEPKGLPGGFPLAPPTHTTIFHLQRTQSQGNFLAVTFLLLKHFL